VLLQINPQMPKFPRAAVSGQMQQQQSSFRKQEAAEDSIMFARCLQMQPTTATTSPQAKEKSRWSAAG